VAPLQKRAVSGSDEGGSDASRGSDKAKNYFPSLPARANQEAGFVPTPRYGRGSDLEVIGSEDRLPLRDTVAAQPRLKIKSTHVEAGSSPTISPWLNSTCVGLGIRLRHSQG
jgi:hypothetical protein